LCIVFGSYRSVRFCRADGKSNWLIPVESRETIDGDPGDGARGATGLAVIQQQFESVSESLRTALAKCL
jgi:hypothetical protein